MHSETFPNDTLDSVACNCCFDGFLGDSQAKPGAGLTFIMDQDGETVIGVTAGSTKYPFISCLVSQSPVFAKPARRQFLVQNLGSQASATLGTTGLDDSTACLGAHAGTEAVGTCTFQYAGLKCSFHVSIRFDLGIRPAFRERAIVGECALTVNCPNPSLA